MPRTPPDDAFGADRAGLARALALLPDAADGPDAFSGRSGGESAAALLAALPAGLPEAGLGEGPALDALAPVVLGGARRLGAPLAFAHMDPPTPWVTWAAALWTASVNQNLLHPDTAPVARDLEARAVAWLAPYFGMTGGHLVPGSTLATLTALWAARELAGVTEVVAADTAHVSVAKSAHLLGLRLRGVPTDARGALRAEALPADLARAALVLTAGSTSTGAVDPLALTDRAVAGAAWTHVDAAWAGPLRLSPRYADRLGGVERADSVAVSGHKWLFQPKESALVLFRDAERAHAALTFGGAYLAAPNVGLLGSHGASAVPLLATLLAWGRAGLAARVEHCMALAERWAAWVAAEPGLELLAPPETGVVVWRPAAGPRGPTAEALHAALPAGAASLTTVGGARWLRNVAANPNADLDALGAAVRRARAPAA